MISTLHKCKGSVDPSEVGFADHERGLWLQDNPYEHSSSFDNYCPWRAWRNGWFAADNANHGETE